MPNRPLRSAAVLDRARRSGQSPHRTVVRLRRVAGIAFLVACLVIPACVKHHAPPSSAANAPADDPQTKSLRVGEVGGYVSNPHGQVNTWWIETGDGLVLIDAQRSIHEAKLAVEAIKATGRPVLAVLITHSHSDHIGGLPIFRDAFGKDLPVHADAVTIEHLRTDPLNDLLYTRRYLGPDFPEEIVIPDKVLANGDSLQFGNITFDVRVLGPGEGASMVLFHVPEANVLFIGDLATNNRTPWLADGHTEAWLRQLADLRTAYPEAVSVYPGHGEVGTMKILDDDAAYIRAVREAVSSYGDGRSQLDDRAIAEISAAISTLYPPHFEGRPVAAGITHLVQLNVVMVARELGRLPGKPGFLGD